MFSPNQVPAQIEKITDSSMYTQEPLSLPGRFELTHPTLSHPGRLVGLLSPIILILLSTVDCLGDQLTVSNTITAQLIRHDLPRLAAMAA